MTMHWRSFTRRRNVVMAGVVTVLLASGGVAVAAAVPQHSTHAQKSHSTETVLTPAYRHRSHPLEPAGGGVHPHPVPPTLTEVPGARPHHVQPGQPVPISGTPVTEDEGHTLKR
ncbi:hypothetical protein ACQPXS_45840 [Streptomyces sp. CA-142005]|uniref:hypothetical protein n=1 Tax=Streptomyces sp. CA-142005 TaxID=3240052 RepID=UPI003D8C41FF